MRIQKWHSIGWNRERTQIQMQEQIQIDGI